MKATRIGLGVAGIVVLALTSGGAFGQSAMPRQSSSPTTTRSNGSSMSQQGSLNRSNPGGSATSPTYPGGWNGSNRTDRANGNYDNRTRSGTDQGTMSDPYGHDVDRARGNYDSRVHPATGTMSDPCRRDVNTRRFGCRHPKRRQRQPGQRQPQPGLWRHYCPDGRPLSLRVFRVFAGGAVIEQIPRASAQSVALCASLTPSMSA